MNHYEIMSLMDEKTLNKYMGAFLASDILKSYESAFGSPQILVYERNILDYITKSFIGADEETRQKFCLSLDGISVTPNLKSAQRIQRKIRFKEFIFRFKCRL